MASLQLVPWNSVAIDLSAPAWWRASPARRRSPKNPLALLLHDLISSCLLQCQQAPGELCMVSITHTNYTFILGKKLIKTSVKAISMQSSSQTISFSLDIFVSADDLLVVGRTAVYHVIFPQMEYSRSWILQQGWWEGVICIRGFGKMEPIIITLAQ